MVSFFALNTTAGFLVPMFSGLLSTFSSATILHIIRKSPEKLSTTYHRLMASMSIFDLIASVSFALVTLPMPKDSVHDFVGPMIGNFHTCQAQGFFVVFGIGGGGSLYMCLSWYFVCKITLKMKTSMIERLLEPMMYLYAIFVAVFFPSYFLSKNLLGPDLHSAYCTLTDYRERNRIEYKDAIDAVAIWVGINFGLISLAMLIILGSILKYSKNVRITIAKREHIQNDPLEETDSIVDDRRAKEDIITDLRYSRAAMIQALMYILAYFLTWLFQMLGYNGMRYDYDIGAAVLFPLQGFWNVIIFVFDKAYLLRHSGGSHEESITWWKAIKIVLRSPTEIPPFVLTNLGVIQQVTSQPLQMQGEDQEQEEDRVDEEMDSNVISVYDDIVAMEEERRSASSYNYSIDSSFADRSGFVSDVDVTPSASL